VVSEDSMKSTRFWITAHGKREILLWEIKATYDEILNYEGRKFKAMHSANPEHAEYDAVTEMLQDEQEELQREVTHLEAEYHELTGFYSDGMPF